MQHRTNTARVALLLVVAALVLQATPAFADTTPKARAHAHVSGSVARHAMGRCAGSAARLSSALGAAFAPGGAAAPMIGRMLDRPLQVAPLTVVQPAPAPTSSPAVVRPRRE